MDFLGRRLIALAAITALIIAAAYVKSWSDLNVEASTQLAVENTATGEGGRTLLKTVSAAQDRLVVLCALTFLGLGFFGCVTVAGVFIPLRDISRRAGELADGKLSVTFPAKGPETVAQLGDALNQIAANYQEVLLLTGTTVGKLREIAHEMEEAAREGPRAADCDSDLIGLIAQMEGRLDTLSDIVQSFEYFQTSFDGAKVVGAPRNPE
jgi:methyl-accepting chemotaxis protein